MFDLNALVIPCVWVGFDWFVVTSVVCLWLLLLILVLGVDLVC